VDLFLWHLHNNFISSYGQHSGRLPPWGEFGVKG